MLKLAVDLEIVDLIIHQKGPKGNPAPLFHDALYRFEDQRAALDALGAHAESLMPKRGPLQRLKRLIRA